MHVFYCTCKRNYLCSLSMTDLVVCQKKVVILSSKDPDETPHDKTSKMGVLCMNAVVISLGILIYA